MNDVPKLIIFDLFDTILDKEWFDYDKLLDCLYDRYFGAFDREILTEWASEFRRNNMLDRNTTNKETSFTDQLMYYEIKSGIRYPEEYESIEWELFRICRGEKVGRHVPEILDYLKSKGYSLAILSNSIFSSKCLTKYLETFGLSQYFDMIYSSADLKMRKPSPLVFNRVCTDFKVNPRDTWFIGNNREKDYQGAKNAGLKAVYYNRLGNECEGYSVSDLIELKTIMGR
jgi:HAD superfamily hydrolase (TIGR01549 family)